MGRLPGTRRLFRLLGRPAPVEQDIDAELEFHFRTEVESLVASGLSREAAEALARKRFGDIGSFRRELARIDRGQRAKERRVRAKVGLGAGGGYNDTEASLVPTDAWQRLEQGRPHEPGLE